MLHKNRYPPSARYVNGFSFPVAAERLSEYISHYEPLNYDAADVHRAHVRAKRSVVRDNFVHLSFRAHSRDFRLRLKRDLSVFSDSMEVHGPQGQLDVDTAHIYRGHIVG